MRSFFIFCALILISSSFSACGGDSDDDVVARVVDMFLDDRSISVGEETVLRIQFRFSEDRVFDDRDGIYLVIQVPAELSFREDSAEIQNDFNDEDVSPLITDCGEGQEKYLRFRFDDEDLRNAGDPSGSADAELALTLDAAQAAELVVISAVAADSEIPFGCEQAFLSDRETSMRIAP